MLSDSAAKDTRLFQKKMSGVYLASQMIAQFAAHEGTYKIGINITEYLIIRFWRYILLNNLFENSICVEWLHKFLNAYDKWNQQYYHAVKYVCESNECFPVCNPVEQRVIIYEMIGYLATYAYFLSFRWSRDEQERSLQIYSSIVQLINENPMFFYPPYDISAGAISMFCRLSDRLGNTENIHIILDQLCYRVALNYRMEKKYPSSADSFEDAVNIYFGFHSVPYQTSAFWGTMLEWFALMEEKMTYAEIRQILSDDLKEVTKCAWFLRAEEEQQFYDLYAMNMAGEGISIEVSDTFEELKEAVDFTMQQYSKEQFTFETYSFDALEFIICRYYGYLPRVKRETRWQVFHLFHV